MELMDSASTRAGNGGLKNVLHHVVSSICKIFLHSGGASGCKLEFLRLSTVLTFDDKLSKYSFYYLLYF